MTSCVPSSVTHPPEVWGRRWEEGGCVPSGAIHAGEYIRPGHWKQNLASAMLILAVMSSSICRLTTISWQCAGRAPHAGLMVKRKRPSYHNVFTVEVKPRHHRFQGVEESHAAGDVQRKLHCLALVHHQSCWVRQDRHKMKSQMVDRCFSTHSNNSAHTTWLTGALVEDVE